MIVLILIIVFGVFGLFTWQLWLSSEKKADALEKKANALEKKADALKKRADALEKFFCVAPPATKDSNVILGIGCSSCDKTFNVDGKVAHTDVCPYCFHVMSSFKLPVKKIDGSKRSKK